MSTAVKEKRWQTVRLGEIAKTSSGGTPKRGVSAYYGGDIPWVKSGELGDSTVYETQETISKAGLENSSAKLFPKGTLCVALYGATVGKLGILGIDAATNQAVCGIFLPDEIDTRFAYRFLESKRRELVDMGKGGAQSNISQEIIRNLEFPLPPLDEQRRIVAEIEKQFTRMDAGVAALQRVRSKLRQYRASVLKSACEGRLVPTEAELAKVEAASRRLDATTQKSRDGSSTYESADQLLQRILTERRAKWNGRGKYKEPAPPSTPDLPQLPEGWVWATVGQLADVSLGKMLDRNKHQAGTQLKYLRNINVRWGFVDTSNLFEMFFKDQEIERYGLRKGDVLVCEGGEPGRAAMWNGQNEGMMYQKAIHRVRQYGALSAHYLVYFLEFVGRSGRLERSFTGSTIKHFTRESFVRLPLPLPPLAEQERIVAEVERRLSVVDELEATVTANLQRAARLRQAILQKAFAGELLAAETPSLRLVDAQTIPAKRPNRHFIRAVLSGEIVHQLHNEPTFGRVKHQKILHLCEYIPQLEEIEGEYHRKAAGPMDNKLIFANVSEMKKQKWYAEIKDGERSYYKPLEKAGSQRKYFERYWPDRIAMIERLLKLMWTWNTENCEIFSTTYAAWNDLLIWGKDTTEEAILHEILDRWDDSKKRIPEKKWRKAISWIERKGFTPVGFGRPTTESE